MPSVAEPSLERAALNLNLQDKVALITGGASGLGRRSAEIFVEEGVGLVIADRDPLRVQETAEDLRRQGGRVLDPVIDVSDYRECVQAVDARLEQFGRLDILVNSAGVADHGLFVETNPESWMRQIDVNLRGSNELLSCGQSNFHGETIREDHQPGQRGRQGG